MVTTRGSGTPYLPPKYQTPAIFSQAGAVQNTWYTLFDTKTNIRVMAVEIACTVANETIEVKWTIDGVTDTSSTNLTAGTAQYAYPNQDVTAAYFFAFTTTTGDSTRKAFLLEARSFKLEIRKTTAAGASALQGKVHYGLW